mmetsp:Transcript_59353/g.190973  ORF Transcript_59353/g.190973 Transcript_59353/m.190973 type:complete len:284 (-) Transcript_59353:1333-2184(-)
MAPARLLLLEDPVAVVLKFEVVGALAHAQALRHLGMPEAVHRCIVAEGPDGVQGLPARGVCLLDLVDPPVLVGLFLLLLMQFPQLGRGHEDHDDVAVGEALGHGLELRLESGVLLHGGLLLASGPELALELVHGVAQVDLHTVAVARFPVAHWGILWAAAEVDAELALVTHHGDVVRVRAALLLALGEATLLPLRALLVGARLEREGRLLVPFGVQGGLLPTGVEGLVVATNARDPPPPRPETRQLVILAEGLVPDVDPDVGVAACPAPVAGSQGLCLEDLEV